MENAIEHRTVEANGVQFHVAVAGVETGIPILFLHGFPEGWLSWRKVMSTLEGCRMYAPDLRGYPGTTCTKDGYDVFTLTDDVKALIEALGLERPVVVSHDWGAELAWIYAHRYGETIRHLIIINGTHPRTLVRAVFHLSHLQIFRIPWVPFFQIPWLPEAFICTTLGRWLLKWSFLLRQGRPGSMDVALIDEIVARFKKSTDMRGPVNYYRQMVLTVLTPAKRRRLYALYDNPIRIPVTAIWGVKDAALPISVAINSGADAGCDVEWRPLLNVDHFVDLEAPDQLAREIKRALDASAMK